MSCSQNRVIEYKCAYKYRNSHIDMDELPYIKDGKLNPVHPYYYQMMIYPGIYNYEYGYFVICTPAETIILEVSLDRDFWKKLKSII